MIQIPHAAGESGEWAALYVAGALEEADVREFERHIWSCAACREEVGRLEGVVAALFESVPPATPDARIREQLLQRIAESPAAAIPSPATAADGVNPQVWRGWTGDQTRGLVTRHADQDAWEETGIAGITLRRLFVDRERNEVTMLVRMAPGTRYPKHIHDGPEQCYVVAGELHVGDDIVMKAGDYQRAEPDSLHVEQWTETGCELFLISSLTDELV